MTGYRVGSPAVRRCGQTGCGNDPWQCVVSPACRRMTASALRRDLSCLRCFADGPPYTSFKSETLRLAWALAAACQHAESALGVAGDLALWGWGAVGVALTGGSADLAHLGAGALAAFGALGAVVLAVGVALTGGGLLGHALALLAALGPALLATGAALATLGPALLAALLGAWAALTLGGTLRAALAARTALAALATLAALGAALRPTLSALAALYAALAALGAAAVGGQGEPTAEQAHAHHRQTKHETASLLHLHRSISRSDMSFCIGFAVLAP